MKSIKYILAASVFLGCYDYSFAQSLNLPKYPLQTTAVVEPNVIFLFDTSGSMGWYLDRFSAYDAVTNPVRMTVAKQVATEIVNETEGVRFCLARFNSNNHGGSILKECKEMTDVNRTSILNAISSLPTSGGTPLAEAYYEVTSYFQGKSSIYNSGVSYVNKSPIEYRCQKNFAIALTDGFPTVDLNFPGLKNPSGAVTPDYDGLHPVVTSIADLSLAGNDHSDGLYYTNGTPYPYYAEGSSFYLDDIAKYAYETDLRGASETDNAGQSFNDSLFSIQNLSTYTVGFTVDIPMLQEAAEYGNGLYQNATNYQELKDYFSSALTDIASQSQSVAAASANSGSLSQDLRIFQTTYIGKDWTGEMRALTLNPSTFALESSPAWVSNSIPLASNTWARRVVLTNLRGGARFRYASFTGQEKIDFFNGSNQILQFIRGRNDRSAYRARDNFLGDIVNSSPVYVAAPTGLPFVGYQDADFSINYAVFIEAKKNRKSLLFSGANDGMLHAFDADSGSEVLAFIPEYMLPKLKKLSDLNYDHDFFVDGTPSVADVFATFPGSINPQWRTMLVGGYGGGGQGIYALNITGADELIMNDASAVELSEWSFSEKDLGYTYSQPQIMRLNDGKFYVVLANGYNSTEDLGNGDEVSTTGDAVLYLIDIGTGQLTQKITTSVGAQEDPEGGSRPNGLATPNGVDTDEDGKVDYVYAGDLFGNMWKFDFTSSDNSQWATNTSTVKPNPQKLFIAEDGNNKRQPITVKPEIVQFSDGTLMVYFGTGKLLEVADTDSSNISAQSFYGIIDKNDKNTVARSGLLRQAITYQGASQFGNSSREIRVSSSEKLDPSTHKGWYLDLLLPSYTGSPGVVTEITSNASYTASGDQSVVKPVYKDGVIRFVTNEANLLDKCLPSSKNFFMELEAESGSRIDYVALDLNGDGVVDNDDGVVNGDGEVVGVSGLTISSNENPVVIEIDDGKDVYVFASGSGGETIIREDDQRVGERTSWREIRN